MNPQLKVFRNELAEYLQLNYTESTCDGAPVIQKNFSKELVKGAGAGEKYTAGSLDAILTEAGESFHEMLFRKISESGRTDVEVYKKANIDRKLFSKIRSNPAYHPKKSTVLALAISLKLNLEETMDLLSRAEYALSPASRMDLIVRFFIEHGIYDIYTINTALYEYDLPVLGEPAKIVMDDVP